MPANITTVNVTPTAGAIPISRQSVFRFSLIPYNNQEIDISSLQLALSIQGGGDSVLLTLSNLSSDVTVTGTASSGYKIEIQPLKNTAYLLPSRGKVQLKISVNNTLGEAARTTMLRWLTIDSEMLGAVSDLIKDVTEISVMNEQGRIDTDSRTVDFSWKNWNYEILPTVYKNGIQIDTGYVIDFASGKIIFAESLDSGIANPAVPNQNWDVVDIITCDYKFSAFSDSELISFTNVALGQFNSANPSTNYPIYHAPGHANAAAVIGGAYFALNSILIGFVNQQSRVKWGEAEWKEVSSTLSSNMGFYKERFEFILAQKKFRLPSSFGIVFPEYSLPGGSQRFTNYLFKHGYDV